MAASAQLVHSPARWFVSASARRVCRPVLAIIWAESVCYRLVSIVLYALVSASVGVLAHLLTDDGRVGALSAILFSVFATHAEPVLWFAATNELLAGVFVLLSTISYVLFRRTGNVWWLVAAGLNCLLGLTSKETALLWPLTLLVYDALWFEPARGKKLDWRLLWPTLCLILLWLAFLLFRIPLGSAYTSAVDFSVPRLAMNLACWRSPIAMPYWDLSSLLLPSAQCFCPPWVSYWPLASRLWVYGMLRRSGANG